MCASAEKSSGFSWLSFKQQAGKERLAKSRLTRASKKSGASSWQRDLSYWRTADLSEIYNSNGVDDVRCLKDTGKVYRPFSNDPFRQAYVAFQKVEVRSITGNVYSLFCSA